MCYVHVLALVFLLVALECLCLLCQYFKVAMKLKNNCSLFERLFKVKKSGVFLFGISFFVLEIFAFLYYANEERDDVIDRSTKTIKY